MHCRASILARLCAAALAALLVVGLMSAPAGAATPDTLISGTVRTSATSSPVGGAVVRAYTAADVATPVQSTTTAGDGSYQFIGLAPGDYKIRFTGEAGLYQDQWYYFAETAGSASTVTIGDGDQLSFIDAYLIDATTSVAGTVRTSDGSNPIQGVIVDMFTTGDLVHPVYSTPTLADGTYEFVAITAGSYKVRFSPDSALFGTQWYYFAEDANAAQSITVSPGLHLSTVDGYLPDATAAVAGTIHDDQGSPIAGATAGLYASGNTTTPLEVTTSAADGSYRFADLTPGIYKMRFSADPALYRTQWYYFADDASSAQTISITPGEHLSTVDGYLPDASTSIAGTVYDAQSVSISGATVSLYTSDSTVVPTRTTISASDGSYRFTGLATGDYKIRFSADPTLYSTQWYYFADDASSAQTITITPGQHLSSVNGYLPDATISISGLVATNGSQGLNGATAQLFTTADTTTPVQARTTAADGSFAFTGLIPGSYLVRFSDSSPLFPDDQWYYVAADSNSATEITVAPGAHQAGVNGYLTATTDWDTTGTPTVAGVLSVGSTLTVSPGSWTPTPTSFQYQWFVNGAPVPGATGATFLVPPAAAGQSVRVAVTGVRTGYPLVSGTADVNIAVASLTPAIPSVTGSARVGATLTAIPGTWGPAPVALQYVWNISGGGSFDSTTATAVIPDQAVGHTVTVTVTGHRTGYTDVFRTSAATSVVVSGTLTAPAPTISGTPAVGELVSAAPGVWGPPTVALTYQWKAAGANIIDATGSTLVVPAATLGEALTVAVTGTRTAYTTVTATSAPTINTALGTLTAPVPTVAGNPVVGGMLTAQPGPWRPYPVLMSYQWNVGGVPFPGATAQTFVIPGSAAGQTVTVTATGTKTAFTTASKTSSPTTAVTGGSLSGPTPVITGTAQVDATLTANPGTWAPAPVTLAYQWKSNGANISGATASTLTVPAGSVGQTITVSVTGSKAGFSSVTRGSAVTTAVTAGVLTAPTPAITGNLLVGSTLTAVTGAWGPAPVTLSYQWKAAGTNISGATNGTYVLSAAELGKTISVTVSGTKTGYTPVSQASPSTAVVTSPTGTLTTAVPVITGTAQVGATLTVSAGTWDPQPVTLTYQWKSDGSNISGETGTTLVVPASSLAQTITVTVTGNKSGYTTASVGSAATATVVAGTLTVTTPTITGAPVTGAVLTAEPGAWGPPPVSLAYQWKAGGTNISGATGTTLTLSSAQLGQTISVTVTGSKTAYTSASQTSASTAAVTDPIGTLTTAVPTITGSPVVDGTLTAVSGTWGPAPVTLSYQWKANGSNISGATGVSLIVPASSVGQTITVTVTGAKTGYTTASVSSVATGTVAAGTLVAPVPVVSGNALVGSALTADPGSWGPGPVTLSYQWKAAGTNISGATGSSLTLAAAQLGQTITVTVTGNKAGYTTASTTSTATGAVAAGTLTAPIPTISGTPVVDGVLTAVPGTWLPAPVALTYQWKANGTNITGETGTSLTLTPGTVGQTITVTVTGTKTGYTTASATSTATGTVAAGTLVAPVPVVSGNALVGSTLIADPGSWGPGPVTLSYQWKAAGTNISGATGSSLTLATAQLGQTITVTVTGTKSGYTTVSKDSAATAVVTAPLGTLTTVTPTITGTPVVDGVLTAVPGTWLPAPVALTYQWKANGTNITGETGTSLTLTAGTVGQTITVTVTGTKAGYTTASATSTATGAVAAGTLTAPIPTISGTPVVDGVLTAVPGAWLPAPVGLTYQWKANGTNITAETGTSLTLTAGTVGQTITVTVTGTKTGYTTASTTSTATGAVAAGTLTAPIPTISGTPVVDGVLTAVPGTWLPAPVALTYQWKANGTNITGETGTSLTLTAGTVGQTITVTVTGTKAGYTTASATSTATGVVAPGTLTALTPTISGSPLVGSILTADPGSWGPAPVVLAYQWKANGTNITGETGTSLTLTPGTVGQTITVTVTGTKTGYTTASATSTATGAVAPSTLTAPTPTISGSPLVGSILTADPGSWGPAPVVLAYQWKANGTNITGETGTSLTLTPGTVGQTITVTVTGTKTGYTTASATSTATAAVAPSTLTGPIPTISGTPKVGELLSVTAGSWAPTPVTLTYAWKANGVSISGATNAFFVPTATEAGKVITVTVTGSKSGYSSVSKSSAATGGVTPGTLAAPVPTITGTTKVGLTLTAKPGTWAPAPVTFKYQWKANNANISGATGSTYKVAAALVGKRITVTVTGAKAGYATLAKTSAATAMVAAGTLTASTPTITGTAKVGLTLTAKPGTWAPAPVTLKYQWKANNANISGATGSTYKVAAALVGKRITVTVTGTKAGYSTLARTSTVTRAVAAGTLTPQTPSISGSAKVGRGLTANPGTWAPGPVTLRYQWKVNGAAVAGKTARTFTIPASAKGKTITVTVTGTKAGYVTAARTSSATAKIT